jgi:hypothetical protein
MVTVRAAPDLQAKLGILSADAQYDLSCACSCATGDPRRRGLDNRWLYPVTLQNGGRSLMFKTWSPTPAPTTVSIALPGARA